MDFSTWIFWLAMIPIMAFIYIVSNVLASRIRTYFDKLSLLFLSLLLLYIASKETLLIFLLVTFLSYIGCYIGVKMEKKRRRVLLMFLIPLLLLPLIYYKYTYFICVDLVGYECDFIRALVIPIGISFYTFQTISYCLDTLQQNKAVPAILDYLNFCSFFPQIVAGPIERRDSLLPQMEELRWKIAVDNLAKGIPYVILGLAFKMVLADNIACGMFAGYTGGNAFAIWYNNVIFGFRIYFDFAGYGLTAYGIAKCLGIKITLNFSSPYTCCNISDFWRNWHISLTQWFRDYIYFSMGGSRTRFWWFNIICMFLISGIWHGAGWNFMIWGGLAGVSMVIHRIYRKYMCFYIPAVFAWILTFAVMMFIWMFFYESDMSILGKNLCSVFSVASYDFASFVELIKQSPQTGACGLTFIGISFLVVILESISRKKMNHPYAIFLSPYICMLMVFAICLFRPDQSTEFIYFAF